MVLIEVKNSCVQPCGDRKCQVDDPLAILRTATLHQDQQVYIRLFMRIAPHFGTENSEILQPAAQILLEPVPKLLDPSSFLVPQTAERRCGFYLQDHRVMLPAATAGRKPMSLGPAVARREL